MVPRQVNPFFSFFGSPHGQGVVFQQVFVNGVPMQTTVFGSPSESGEDDDFFQTFMNHGNFMRQNRVYINADRLVELLEQLRNPNRGVRREDLSKIKKKQFVKSQNVVPGEEEKCPICITEFEDKETVKNLPCNHIFHENCIDTWLVQNSHCPICKYDLLQRDAH